MMMMACCGEEVVSPWVWWAAVDVAVAVVVGRRSWEKQRWWAKNVVAVLPLPLEARMLQFVWRTLL